MTIHDNDALGLISINSDGTRTGNGDARFFYLSDDGRFVAFESRATDLVPNFVDGNGADFYDVYVRDRLTGVTTLVSRNFAGTASGNSGSELQAISPNGQYVLFRSGASDLVDGISDTNDDFDTFVYDQFFHAIVPLSVNPAGNEMGNGRSISSRFSGNGQFVFFESFASNLVDGVIDNNDDVDLYRRDLLGQTTVLVSQKADGTAASSVHAELIGSSTDGRFALFASRTAARDIVGGTVDDPHRPTDLPDDPPFLYDHDLFWRDIDGHQTKLVTVNSNGDSTINATQHDAVISGDGKFVAFDTNANDVVGSGQDPNHRIDIFLRNMETSFTRIIRGDSSLASPTGFNSSTILKDMTPDGRYIVFTSGYPDLVAGMADTNGEADVFVYDLREDRAIPVSVNSAGTAMGNASSSLSPQISDDGRFLTFISDSTDLVADIVDDPLIDTPIGLVGTKDVFLRDLENRTTSLLSVRSNGTETGHGAFSSIITPNGQFVAFDSYSNSLISGLGDVNEIGQPVFHTLKIFVSPGAFIPGTIQFSDVDVRVDEDSGAAILTLQRTGGTNGSFDFRLTTSSAGGAATENVDYDKRDKFFTFPDSQTTLEIPIPLNDDGLVEGDETFKVTLTDFTGLNLLGSNTTATVTIVDNDVNVLGNQIIEADGDGRLNQTQGARYARH